MSCPYCDPALPAARIKIAVGQYYGVTIHELMSATREARIAYARHVAMYLVREIANYTYPRIGREFDRDHTSVMHGCRRIVAELGGNPTLRRDVAALTSYLQPEAVAA